MPRGKMAPEAILAAVQNLLAEAAVTGDKLTGAAISRRVGCGRTTLYTNPAVRALLLQAGVIEDAASSPRPEAPVHTELAKVPSATERRLRKAEDRANRLEQLYAQAQEEIRVLRAENESLKLRLRLMGEGRIVL